jgi:hypothetical protein
MRSMRRRRRRSRSWCMTRRATHRVSSARVCGTKYRAHFRRHPRTPISLLTLRNAAKRRVSKGEAEAFPRGRPGHGRDKRLGLVLRDASRSLSSGRASRGPVGDAPQHEGLRKRAWPCRDGTIRSLSCLLFNCQTADAQTCVIAPVLISARGSPSHSLFLLPIGACGTTGQMTAPAAPACFACEHPV